MPAERLTVLRLANFVSPTSGGIRTVLRRLSHAQADLGVRSMIVVPGPSSGIQAVEGELEVGTLPGVRFAPGQPYRLVLDRRAVRALLDEVRPDIVEVHDQLTLAWLGTECARRGIHSVLVVHERLDLLTAFWSRLPIASGPTARWLGRVGRSFDVVVAPSRFAAAPFAAAGIDVQIVHWGVEGSVFRPDPPVGPRGRGKLGEPAAARGRTLRLIHAGRLSAEKDPGLSVRTAEYLARQGLEVELAVIGAGPQGRRVAQCPLVRMVGYLDGPERMARTLREADVFMAPGPFETFGVSALEAMACGLPVVCRESGSISEIPGTHPAPGTARGFGEAAKALADDRDARARSAQSAKQYTWARAASELATAYRCAS